MRYTAVLLAVLLLVSGCSQASAPQAAPAAAPAASAAPIPQAPASSGDAAPAQEENATPESANKAPLHLNAPQIPAAIEQAAQEALSVQKAAEEAARQAQAEEQARKAQEQAALAARQAEEEAALAAAAEEEARAVQQAAEEEAAKKAREEQTAREAEKERAALQQETRAAKPAPAAETAPPEAKPVTGTNFLSKIETRVLNLQNEERERLGLEPLSYDVNLRSAARIRSRELYQNDMFAHTRPDGTRWDSVLLEDLSVDYRSAGENLCMVEYNDPSAHYATDPKFWVNKWIESEAHYENMIREDFTHMGVGIYCITKNGMTYAYATTIFASYR